MPSKVEYLKKQKLITPPIELNNSIQYETIMGSEAYGVSSGESDVDIYGFCIPPKEVIFPHLTGQIQGFGNQIKRFEQFQHHHITDPSTSKEYDIAIYNIIKYFQLCMENNPNMIDSLFTPRRCVLHSTQIGEHVRENRRIFLHKGSFYKYKGYAFSQLHKVKTKNPEGKRKEIVEKYGFDVKFSYHICRLLNQIEQILIEGDLDLERNREQLKSIRRGEWTLEQIENYFNQKERALEDIYFKSVLPHSPNEKQIKKLLLECLEMYFGDISSIITIQTDIQEFVKDIITTINKHSNVKY